MNLTTNHPASSYGIPVLVDDDGTAYGPDDVFPQSIYSSPVKCRELNFRGFDAELVKKFLGEGNYEEKYGRVSQKS